MDLIFATLAQFDSEEYGAVPLFAICLLPAAIGSFAFLYFMRGELKGWPKSLKWTALLPLIVGMVIGIGPFRAMNDELYRDQYGSGPRAQLLHYGGVGIPILTALGLVVFGILHDRQRVDEF